MAHPPLTERVYYELKRDILTCALRPAQAVYEAELAQRYGVSKTPIREALNTLRQEGYVQVVPRRGYIIAPVSIQDVQQIFDTRLVLEPAGAELAAQRVTGDELRRLRQLLQRGTGQGRSGPLPFNRAFHLAVAEASGNTRLAAFVAKLLEEVDRVFHLSPELREANASAPNRHPALLDALIRGEAQLARDTMVAAIEDSRTRVMQALLGGGAPAQAAILIASDAPLLQAVRS